MPSTESVLTLDVDLIVVRALRQAERIPAKGLGREPVDYVAWCDSLADALADFAESQPSRYVYVQQFAREFLIDKQLSNGNSAEHAAIIDTIEILRASGLNHLSGDLFFKHADLALLRDSYSRWKSAHTYELNDLSLILLGTLNALSKDEHTEFTTV